MDQEAVNKDLAEKTDSEFQKKVCNFVRNNLSNSTAQMQEYHPGWDDAEMIYRGYRILDKKDDDAITKKEPPKIIIPVSYALSQTALGFLMSTLFVDDKMYRLGGTGPEDQRGLEGLQQDLDHQMDRTKAYSMLYNWLQDSFKYGFGVVKSTWTEEHKNFRVSRNEPVGGIEALIGKSMAMLGRGTYEPEIRTIETIQNIKTFEGTQVRNVSPYCFYPDPSVPLARFQEGSFVASEEETTRTALATQSQYYGVSKIPNTMPTELYMERDRRVGRYSMFSDLINTGIVDTGQGSIELKDGVIHSEMQFTMTGRQLKNVFDYDLKGFPMDEPVKMVLSVANDQKVIQFEPLGYLHGMYTYDVIEYSPDHCSFANPGLTETIYNMQEIMTWFLNSHVLNVRKAIRNRFIVDPEKIRTEDITAGKEFIRTRGGTSGRAVTDSIHSINVADVTRGHVADMQVINQMIQMVTGINENALGQYAPGRRSAREAQSVTNSAATRLKMHGMLAWAGGIEPLGQKIIANTNQLRSREFYEFIVGENATKFPYDTTILRSSQEIVGGFSFVPYDGMMPNERAQRAQYFTNLLQSMASKPIEMQQLLQVDMQKVLGHIFELYGVKNFDDYKLTQQPLGAQVVPDAQAAAMAQGGAAPVDLGSSLLA